MDSEKSSRTTGTPTTTRTGPLIPLSQPNSHHHDRNVGAAAATPMSDDHHHDSTTADADTNVDTATPTYPTTGPLRSIGA